MEGYVRAEVASDTLVALSRNHFSLVMYELQLHLKALNLTEESVIVTLAKLANGNVDLPAPQKLLARLLMEGYVRAEVASDTLVALSRNHFSLVMYELQHHLKPLNLTEESVIVTLAKLANGNAMETFCETVQFYLRHLEDSVYPVMTEDQFALKLFPVYRYFVTVWLRNNTPEVRMAMLRIIGQLALSGFQDRIKGWVLKYMSVQLTFSIYKLMEGYVRAEVASDTLVALSRNHFSLVMYELQHHLKPLNLTEESVIVTLAKLANGNEFWVRVPCCIMETEYTEALIPICVSLTNLAERQLHANDEEANASKSRHAAHRHVFVPLSGLVLEAVRPSFRDWPRPNPSPVPASHILLLLKARGPPPGSGPLISVLSGETAALVSS
ncbi:unnamed protein product [Rangifer tarandus platyrhynchus]|uniref:Uncharacterized protein n=1 Tax=Rangifer tarandus platyrhynchus TaxID=3082113 RepID=A0AC59Y434_RANTA